MKTAEGFLGLACLSCGTTAEPHDHRCPECGGILDPIYDDQALARAHEHLFEGPSGSEGGLDRYEGVLPFDSETLVTLSEGGASVVSCPGLADEIGVGRVLVADEGHNPTGGLVDRELALGVTAARETGAETVALPTTGNGGQAAAAYGARANLDVECFVPSRSVFANKALINVHGGEMSVVGGRYGDAVEAFADASTDESWYSLAPFETPYRHEGAKTLAYDLVRSLDVTPDAVVHPTSHGTGLVGLEKGFREIEDTGHIDGVPRLYAAQPTGCSPLVDAFEAGATAHDPVEFPDTITGALEAPDPAGGHLVLDALAETGGGAAAVEDDTLLEGAVSLAGLGIPMSATGGAAVGGAQSLADGTTLDDDDVVVLVNPATANREADILRSHLMKQGV